MPVYPSNLVELLEVRSATDPSRSFAFSGGHDERSEDRTLTFAALGREARSMAVQLQKAVPRGARAVLCYPPGLEFIKALFGCIYAGLVAVPVELPKREYAISRFRAIVADAEPAVVLTSVSCHERVASLLGGATLCALSAEFSNGDPEQWRQGHTIQAEEVAYLQFTSGSTCAPRGVEISHSAVLANLRNIDSEFEHDSTSVSVSWLPHFHDMGLVYGIFQPLFNAFDATLISPAAFIHDPMRWLRTITIKRATHSGGPDFGYAHCVRGIRDEDIARLDLRRWRVAFSGAERVRRETMDAFARKFAACGFDRNAFFPSYGLAEATLKVTSRAKSRPVAYRRPLSPAQDLDKGVAYTSCGVPGPGTKVVIVDPEKNVPLPDGHIGEIWVHTDSVASGYWCRPETSQQVFRARLQQVSGSLDTAYLRTGDLGFLREGELHVTGRLKDLVIIGGRNYHAEDIEAAVAAAHPDLRARRCAAFSVHGGWGEELIVLFEAVSRKPDDSKFFPAIRQAIASHLDLPVQSVGIISRGGLPVTSSGKVRRSACRERWLSGDLPLVACDGVRNPVARPATGVDALRKLVADCLGIQPEEIDEDRPLREYGISSLRVVNIQVALEDCFGLHCSVEDLLAGATLRDLTGRIDWMRHALVPFPAESVETAAPQCYPASLFQQRIWELHRIAPHRAMLTLARSIDFFGSINIPALCSAFLDVARRHPVLGSTFYTEGGKLWAREGASMLAPIPVVDLRGLTGVSGEQARHELEREFAAMRFDPAAGPLLAAAVVLSENHRSALLWSISHLVADALTIDVIEKEIALLCQGDGNVLPGGPPYATFAQRQIAEARGGRIAEQTALLASQFRDVQALAWTEPRDAHAGRLIERLEFSSNERQRIDTFCRGADVSLFMFLLCACELSIAQSANQPDFAVSFPVDCRPGVDYGAAVGCFANRLACRVRLDPAGTLRSHLASVRARVLGVLECRNVTIKQVTDALLEENGGADLRAFSQVLFQARTTSRPSFANLHAESRYLAPPAIAFDLVVSAEVSESVSITFLFNRLHFDNASAQALVKTYREIVSALLDDDVLESKIGDYYFVGDADLVEVTVTSNFVAEGIRESFAYWMNELSVKHRLTFAPAEQVLQWLLDPDAIPSTRRGVLLVLLQLERWCPDATSNCDLTPLASALRSVSERAPGLRVVTMFCLPSPPRKNDEALHRQEIAFATLAPFSDVVLSRTIERLYPVERYFDPYTNQIAQVPYTRLYFASLGTMAARRIQAFRRRELKVIVVDADNTLWSGISAETSPLGVVIDEQRAEFQRFLLRQREAGRLLAICSKNAEADVLNVLDKHPGMLIRREHFSGMQVNWKPKSASLIELAAEFGLDLGTFAFIDDNPVECAEVQARLPQVLTVNLPFPLTDATRFLDGIWDFDIVRVTPEDRLRSIYYEQRAARDEAERNTCSVEEFLISLNLDVNIEPITEQRLTRASQLAVRTTQFNLNGKRLMESELSGMASTPGAGVLTVSAQDRFGDYGMVGLIAFRIEESLTVETFLLSCRALAKRIEHRMALWLARVAEDAGISTLRFRFVPTARNIPVRTFLQELGVALCEGSAFTVPAARVREVCDRALGLFAGSETMADLCMEKESE